MANRIFVATAVTAALAGGTVYAIQKPEIKAEVKERVRGVVASVGGPKAPTVVVPAGTLVSVRLDDRLSTESSRVGDVLHATVTAPVEVDGDTVIPAGAAIQGYVAMVEATSPLNGRGHLQFKYERLRVGDAEYNLDSPSVIYDVAGIGDTTTHGSTPPRFEPGTLLRFSLDHELALRPSPAHR